MDQELIALLGSGSDADQQVKLAADGTVTIELPQGAQTFKLKPLAELYGPGHPGEEADPEGDTFMPLFMAVEEVIVTYFRGNPALTDSQVTQTLDRMGLRPETEPASDDFLGLKVLARLRLLLSVSNFSRQELRTAVRKIGRSVARHSREGGVRGYLSFINQMLPG